MSQENKSDSGEVGASKDNSQVDAPENKDGGSGNADDSGKSQDEEKDEKDETEKKEEKPVEKKVDLEEMTYKERYANSTKEMQALKEDPEKLKKFLGLDPDASLDEHFGFKKEPASSENDDEESEKDQETDDEEKDETEQGSDENLDYKKMQIKNEEQAAIDLVWDNFAEKHPEIDKNPKVRESMQRNFFRFLTDEAGNRRKLKYALEDTFRFISMDDEVKKAQNQGRNEGIIKSQQNKEGTVQSSASKTPKTEPKGLTEQQKTMAAKLGIKEEDYLKNIKTEQDED